MIPGLNKRVVNFYDLMIYVALARKHLRLMILLVCASLLAGVAVYAYSRPVYFASALIHVNEMPLPVDSDTVYHDSSYNSIASELKSPAIVERTAHRLGVDADYRTICSKYLRMLRIRTNPEGTGLEVEVFSYQPSWPAAWTEIMVEEFIKQRDELRQQYRDDITKSWGNVVGEASRNLDANIDSHFDFTDQSKLTSATIDMNSLRDIPVRLVQIQQRIDTIDAILKKIDDPSLGTEARLSLIDSVSGMTALRVGQVIAGGSAPGVADDTAPAASPAANGQEAIVLPSDASQPEWQKLDGEERAIDIQIADASRTYLPGNRKMVALKAQLDSVRTKLELAYESARNRLTLERQSLIDQQQFLKQKLPQYEEVNRQFQKLQEHTHLHDAGDLAWQAIATGAEKYINQLDYISDKERVNLQYYGLLDMKKEPVSPNKLNLCVFSLLLGFGLAFGIPFLIEYLDYTLCNLEEVEATFQMRGLGIIPQMGHEASRPVLIDVSADGAERNLVENFRVVRTNLLAMGTISKPAHVTMVTSAMPKEGKTVVSSNLAISFGQTGARTLLVDTDMRRGRLHRLFGLRKSPGLSDYLLEKVPLTEAIRSSGKENLWILSAGQHVESGTELLGSSKFGVLMQKLRSEYDRVIVDTPPVLGLSETSVLQSQVDGVLFVIWSGRTPIRNMKTAVDILAANGANFYGFILNRLDLTATMNYYQYYYYSSDYYDSYHALENA